MAGLAGKNPSEQCLTDALVDVIFSQLDLYYDVVYEEDAEDKVV